ncbi:hypothetical protein PV327_008705 [Microctonus hyperodae]|uniref:F-box protein n=1 Tax=Microctonus hyperodae TaxID=165561 RepID=A0AA39F3S2_MICHY|nr:hypothetical protein PV327_008705 [Microctonus hyperodae]
MGQMLTYNNNNNYSPRVPYEENGDNGLVMCDKYIPEELITEILCYVDYKSLLNCQLVCKRWQNLLQDYVWRKKAEIAMGHSLQSVKIMPWNVYYKICKKKPIATNLLKNNSGQNNFSNWIINRQGGDHWKVENPPVGVPSLPESPIFEGNNCCFVTSYSTCIKKQIINLTDEDLSFILDALQPSIVVSEWYSGRWDCPSVYECSIRLLGENDKVLDMYQFREHINGDEKQNIWHHFEHEFSDYGLGLKTISFEHSGSDTLFWAGHYGSKMAGASVIMKFKSNKRNASMENSTSKENESSTDSKVNLRINNP